EVLVKKVDKTPAPTKGRAVDHLSWAFDDLDAAAVDLKAKGVKFDSGPYAWGNGKIAFVQDPFGVLIELVGPAAKK
ncbi:MAG TPA: VOC family protein, partial [Planctomycetaceae bacterium]|nr:VOC family protein [Planctomycetaceae bacterium]